MFIFEAVFPVVCLAALGYLARAARVFSELETNAIERLAFWYLLPCLLFYGTATAAFPEQMDWHFLFGFYFAVFVIYALGMLAGKLLFGQGLRELAVFGMGCSYSNVTVLGIPITLQVVGEAAFVPMLVLITVHNLLLYTFGTLLAELRINDGKGLGSHILRIGRDMLLNPISGSLLAGAAWNLSGLGFVVPVQATLELIRPAAIPMALFALGAGLHRYHIRGALAPALVITVFKLLLMPGLTWWVMTQWFSVDAVWAKAAVLLSCMPTGISVYVFSRRFASNETAVATAIVLTSLGAVPCISLFVWLLQDLV